MIFLCIFPLFSFFWPHASFSDIIIYIPTHIREELCEAALKSDSAAVHDGTRRRILIVAHRCACHGLCVDRSIRLCQVINTSLLGERTVTTAHYDVRPYCVCLSSSFHLPICLTKLFLGFVFMCATTERASENFPKWAMERRSVTRPTAVWRPSGMLLSPWLSLSGHAFLILKWLFLQGHAFLSRPSGPLVPQVCMTLYIILDISLSLIGPLPLSLSLSFSLLSLFMDL